MRRDCPCYELTDGCGCSCCIPPKYEDQSVTVQQSNAACVESDEYPCECHSNEYLMLQAGIDPQLAMHGGQSFTSQTAYEIKQGRREAY